MKINYMNNLQELETLLYYYNENLTDESKRKKYFIAFIPTLLFIYQILMGKNIIGSLLCLILIPIAFLTVKQLEPALLKHTFKKEIYRLYDDSNYFFNIKILEVKDEYLKVFYGQQSFEINLNNKILLKEKDDYIIIIDLSNLNNKSKLIIPNNAFDDKFEKETFINLIKERINNK